MERNVEDKQNLRVTFNRKYTVGHMYRASGKELMNSKTCNHQGIEIGKVVKVNKK